jgi:penicillin-binding protein 2
MTESKTRTRMKVLAGLVVFMFAALTTRLWFLQVLATEEFAELANNNQVRLVPLQPLRGQILDRHGNILAGNRPSTIVTVDRMAMRGSEEQVLFRLSTLLNLPVTDLLDRLNSVKYLPYQPVPVAEDVPKEAVFYIEEHRNEFPGVSYQVGAVRSYQYGTLASHLLGWTGEISDDQLQQPEFKNAQYRPGAIVGKSGVEATYERYLHGEDGKREIQVTAQGKVLDENFNVQAPKQGNNVVLSIDGKVQQLAEQSLQLAIDLAHRTADRYSGQYLRATGGAVIVMDPRNGKILALASNPTFDPSIFLGGLNRKEALGLDLCFGTKTCPKPSHNNPLLDRAIQGLYPGGSTFKPFVAVSALKEKFARMNGRYPCPSIYYAPVDPTRHPFHNWSSLNYGNLSLPDALAYSCDTVFYKFGYDFWVRYHRSGQKDQSFQNDLASIGFGKKTGIDLPGEQHGRIPDHAYVKKLYDSNPCFYGSVYRVGTKPKCSFLGWLPGDAINLSIGQGFMTVTPLQLAVAYSAIANGGTIYAPRVVDRIETPDGDLIKKMAPEFTGTLPIPRRQVLFLRNALKGVTRYGTAHTTFEGFPLDRIPVAGKTGTADILPLQPTSWFAAMAPADHPKYVVIGMVEQGGHGSTTAAPLVRRVLEGLFGLNPPPQLKAGSVVD